jgi:hypothetical protein
LPNFRSNLTLSRELSEAREQQTATADEVSPDGLTVRLRTEGLASLAADLRQRAAA